MIKVITATERDGLDTRILTIPCEVLPEKESILPDLVRKAVADYCETAQGKQTLERNHGSFDWADFAVNVPNDICNKYGFEKIGSFVSDIVVDWDEQLMCASCKSDACETCTATQLANDAYKEYGRREITDWFAAITDGLRDYSEGDIWTDGTEILVRTKSAADTVADLLETLYRVQGSDVRAATGYYDPEEDEKNGETDRYSGWWYVTIQ